MFTLSVLANNSRSHTHLVSTATVTITVTDLNDETPQFEQQIYMASLSELTEAGSLINITVFATDNDEPEVNHFYQNDYTYNNYNNNY